jgi:hypothetical protein
MPFINDCDPATALVFSPGLGCFQGRYNYIWDRIDLSCEV